MEDIKKTRAYTLTEQSSYKLTETEAACPGPSWISPGPLHTYILASYFWVCEWMSLDPFGLFFFLFFSHKIHPPVLPVLTPTSPLFPPPISPPPTLSLRFTTPLFLFIKEQASQWYQQNMRWTKMRQMKRCHKTMHKPSYKGWTNQPSRRKRVPRWGKRVRDTPYLS